ncbi:WD repeat-containing protein 89-like [Ostrea edulis]|uniref:WD repeat-containing protein 89-like n=1 Tax=Ostrea edulis TaxID=37623 RepID=UPI0024AFB1F3|nr:WD repeat-containing protein 89-like [Ostrea edulis]XP_048779341.2 WD repeat-containing protein 89-like [Ostrea edulis]
MAGVEGSLTSHLQSLTLSDKSAIALKKVEENYILDIAVQTNTPGKQKLVAATSSNHDIRLYQHADLAMVGKLRGHSDVITGIQFANTEEDILFSSALDKCIKCWDKRSGKCVQNFEAPEEIKGLSSFGINCNDRVLAGGTECLTTAEDIHILFWDRRKTEVMGSYSESHQDDITQVKFHPSQPDNLATGSTDGLVCVFDISLTSEDDAITWTFNTESSVARIGWTGEKQSDVYCITHDDTLHVWDSVEGDDVLNRTNIRDELQDTELFDYMVDCIYVDQLYLVLGTHSGELRIATVDETLKIVKTLKGGHSSTVRCLHWDNTTCTLLSGAEDSLLCKWSDCVQKPDTQRVNFKMKKKEAKKVKPY